MTDKCFIHPDRQKVTPDDPWHVPLCSECVKPENVEFVNREYKLFMDKYNAEKKDYFKKTGEHYVNWG
jgi:hypothetical protein